MEASWSLLVDQNFDFLQIHLKSFCGDNFLKKNYYKIIFNENNKRNNTWERLKF